jgi:hypothetical protein
LLADCNDAKEHSKKVVECKEAQQEGSQKLKEITNVRMRSKKIKQQTNQQRNYTSVVRV